MVRPGDVRLFIPFGATDDQRRRGIDAVHDDHAERDLPLFGVILRGDRLGVVLLERLNVERDDLSDGPPRCSESGYFQP